MARTVETLGATVDDEIAALPPKVQAKLVWIMEQIEARGTQKTPARNLRLAAERAKDAT